MVFVFCISNVFVYLLLGDTCLTMPEVHNSPIQATTTAIENPVHSVQMDILNDDMQKNQKRKFACPVCKIEVIHLPNHMSKIRNWSSSSSKSVVSQFGLRKSRSSSYKDYRTARCCPIEGCGKVVQRLTRHLEKLHKVVDKEERAALLKSSKVYNKGMVPNEVVASPKKVFGFTPCKRFSKANEVISGEKSSNTASTEMGLENVSCDFNKQLCVNESPEINLRTKLHLPCYAESGSPCSESSYHPSDLDESTCLIDVDHILSRYNAYLIGPCRNKSKETAGNAVQNIRRICTILDVDKISDLFNRHKELLLYKYLGKICIRRNTKASTIRTYLNDLVDFAKYLIATEENLEDLSLDKINAVMRSLEMWRKGYVMKAGRENQKRRKNEQQNLISQADVQKYDGENAVNARQIFKRLEENVYTEVNMSDYVCIRDHHLVLCSFSTSNRSGVNANMTMNEFTAAKLNKKGDRIQIDVEANKTYIKYGDAEVNVTLEVYYWLKLFKMARSRLPVIVDDYVFLSWSGKKMQAGAVSDKLNTQFINAGVISCEAEYRLTTNLIRKSTVSALMEQNCPHTKEVSLAMMHSEKTQKMHYWLSEKEKNVDVGSKVIYNHYFPRGVVSSETQVSESMQSTELCHLPQVSNTTSTPPRTSTNLQIDTLTPSHQSVRRNTLSTPKRNSENYSPRKRWSEFESELVAVSPVVPTTRHSPLPKLDATPRQVYDKYRYIKKTEKITQKGKRVSKWTVEEQQMIVDSGILKERTTENNIKELLPRQITEKYFVHQIRTRINHMRKTMQ